MGCSMYKSTRSRSSPTVLPSFGSSQNNQRFTTEKIRDTLPLSSQRDSKIMQKTKKSSPSSK